MSSRTRLVLLALLLSASSLRAAELPPISISGDGRGFTTEAGRFTPWGFNYDHDPQQRLIEDYWSEQWPTIEEDFAEMKMLGANVVRVHLQFGRFMNSPTQARPEALKRLDKLLTLAQQTGLYLDLTGLGCYHKDDVPDWYDALSEQERWKAQAKFWESIAKTCSGNSAVFCYDLMNEPVVGGAKKREDWLGPGFGGKHFVQFISLETRGRKRHEIARRWIQTLKQAIRKHDQRTLITVGLVHWSLEGEGRLYSGFDPKYIADELDFLAFHLYPEKGKVAEAVATAERFAAAGKPCIIEETFTLKCGKEELGRFITETRPHVQGWIGFYWGKKPEEYQPPKSIADGLTHSWLTLFQEKRDEVLVARRAKQPNILFIAVDDLRPELNCYGQRHIKSPNIDRLARTGVLFERAYCMVPTCGASRASLMTGIRPTRNRFKTYLTRADQDAPDAVTMNSWFKRNGYYTVSLGKVFHHAADSAAGWSEPAWRPRGVASYQLPENAKLHRQNQAKAGRKKRGPAWESADVADDAYADGVIANQAIKRLGQLKTKSEPFFLAVGFLKPHLPFVAPEKYWKLYDPEKISLPDNYSPPKDAPKESIHTSGELRAYAGIPPKGKVSDATAKNLIHGYYACVSYTDAQIGRLLDAVDELQLSENTIVVLWGDHGWNLGEHTLWCKHSCYETSMRIPLVVRAPGINAARRSGLIETVDLYPTLCELAGLAPPKHLQGDSFAQLMRQSDAPWKTAAVGRFKNGDTVRTQNLRYTEYTDGRSRVIAQMLYDHANDPDENRNVAAESADDVKQLRRRLRAIRPKTAEKR